MTAAGRATPRAGLFGGVDGGIAAPASKSERPIRNLFLFIGADPATELARRLRRRLDRRGFVVTGTPRQALTASTPAPLESSVPGVFAVGDVRSGSVKRVGGAIGEGAAVVAQIHRYLASMHPAH